jgi:hypothetical protein
MKLVAIYDKVVKAYQAPFCMTNLEQAVRSFANLVNDESGNEVNRNPGDFSLYCLADYDELSGTISSFDPFRIVSALELVRGIEIVNSNNK